MYKNKIKLLDSNRVLKVYNVLILRTSKYSSLSLKRAEDFSFNFSLCSCEEAVNVIYLYEQILCISDARQVLKRILQTRAFIFV